MRYRQATRDMNKRYPDATAEEITREDVCIICRENMRAWSEEHNDRNAGDQANNDGLTNRNDERSRPKKLPCGHILHFACLRSWLERQQNCPTCRRPVLVPNAPSQAEARQFQHQQGRVNPPVHANQAPLRGQAGQVDQPGQNAVPPQNIYQFGPIRIAFGARQLPQRPQQNDAIPSQQSSLQATSIPPRSGGPLSGQLPLTHPGQTPTVAQLQQIEQQLMSQINGLRLQHDQLYLVRALQGELTRLRLLQANTSSFASGQEPGNLASVPVPVVQPGVPVFTTRYPSQAPGVDGVLPTGMTIPTGWTLVPLRRLVADRNHGSRESRSPNDHSTGMESRFPVTTPNDMAGTTTIHSQTPMGEPHEVMTSEEPRNSTNTTAQSTENIDVNESSNSTMTGSHQSSAGQIKNTASQSGQDLPNWSSEPSTLEAENAFNSLEGSTDPVDVETQAARGALERETRNKGKGKATTVEDGTEDVD